ncbi:MAG: hypothetical protein D6790_07530 [Caldilineae bacterium]|nr:MAG: hypothetical protein D6790_07530 [Caldilineae bacterium]
MINIDPFLGKAAFHIGFYVVFVAGGLLLVLDKETAEFVITQFTFGMGVVFLLIVAVLVRMSQKRK